MFPYSKYHFPLFLALVSATPSGINSRHFQASYSFGILLLSSTDTSWQLVFPHIIPNERCVVFRL